MTTAVNSVFELASAAFASRALHVVAGLGVADHIADDPVPIATLAASCGAEPGALARVLRLLAAHDVFAERGGGWAHTPLSLLLRDDDAMSMRAFVRVLAAPAHWGGLGALEHSVRSGAPAMDQVDPRGVWCYLREHPEEAELFNHAMTAKANGDIAAVLASYDFSQFTSVADIGGGRGHLMRAVLDVAPRVEGILFDQPEVIATLDLEHPRLAIRAGDFFVDPLPVADAYVLMEVINDWPDERAAEILAAVHRAAPAGATLLFIEGILAGPRPDPLALTVDVIMLAMTGGQVRTVAAVDALLGRTGFETIRTIDTAGRVSIIEARAV